MRKNSLIFLLFLFTVAKPLLSQNTLYFQNFDGVSAPALPPGWSSSTSTTVTANNTGSPGSGANNLFLANCTPVGQSRSVTVQGVINTTNDEGLTLSFYHRATGAFDVPVTLAWSSNGSSYNTLGAYSVATNNSMWEFISIPLPIGTENVTNLRFRFSWITDDNNNCLTATPNYRIDDFLIEAITLPISLLTFTATPRDGNTDLLWATATETQNAYFSLERSADGVHFDEIAQVPGAGNSAATQTYTYTDRAPLNGANFYRLRQVDFDGAYTFSPVRRVVFGQANAVRLQPVPATETLQVLLDEVPSENMAWSVYDQAGRLVLDGYEAEETAQFDVDVQTLPQGVYVLRLTAGQLLHTVRFVKQQ